MVEALCWHGGVCLLSEKKSNRWWPISKIHCKNFSEFFVWGILLAVVYGILQKVLSAPFVFDDFANIVQNRSIRYLLHPRIFFENQISQMRPLTSVSYAWNYWRAGLSLSEFRNTNIFLHFLNATLLWIWLRKIHPWAWWGAILFLVHPIAADASIYLTARSSLLCFCFILLALLSARQPTFGRWLLYLFFSVAAFFSREVAMVIPFLLFLQMKMRRQSLAEIYGYLWPWVFGGVVFLIQKQHFVNHVWRKTFRVHDSADIFSMGEFFRLHVSLWPKVLWQFVRPWNQALDPAVYVPPSWLSATVIMSLAVVLVTWIVSAFALTRKLNFFYCGIAWIFFSLLPTNSFFPNLDPFGERHFYFALPGVAILFCAALSLTQERVSRFAAVLLGLLVLGGALLGFYKRVPKWITAVSIWEDSYEKYPGKFRVMFNLANAWTLERGDNEKALVLYLKFLDEQGMERVSFEEMEIFMHNLQFVLTQTTKPEKIESVLNSSLKPGFWREYCRLILDPQVRKNVIWQSVWEKTFVQYKDIFVVRQSPHLYRDLLLLLAADRAAKQQNFLEAYKFGSIVFESFDWWQFPYWSWQERYGDILMHLHRDQEALLQYERAKYRHIVYKRYSSSLMSKIYELYTRKSDWISANDILGKMVRVQTDEVDLRKKYAESLRRAGSTIAARHDAEGKYYEEFAVRPEDDRETIKP